MVENIPNLSDLQCPYAGVCSGCPSLHLPYAAQVEMKLAAMRSAWQNAAVTAPLPQLQFRAIASGGIRDRADFQIDRRAGALRFGLFQNSTKEILDLESCAQLSTPLQNFFSEVRSRLPDVERGSVRIRVAPDGSRGIWLDLANLDVKRLLEERTQLLALKEIAFVELGQKRKALIERDGQLKLGEPVLQPWFETYIDDQESTVPVYTTVGGFTQPGFLANRELMRALRECLKEIEFEVAVEFGSGSGNLTLPLASLAKNSVSAYEVDELALDGLTLSAERAGLSNKIEIHRGNFQLERNAPALSGVDLVLVDPPRSGLMGFLTSLSNLEAKQRPQYFVYVSCFADSFSQDAARLVELGYKPERLLIVDQFRQSAHFESVALFRRTL